MVGGWDGGGLEGWISGPVKAAVTWGVEKRELLAAGSLCDSGVGCRPLAPRLRAVAVLVPAVTGHWGWGPWGDRNNFWGYFSCQNPQKKILDSL